LGGPQLLTLNSLLLILLAAALPGRDRPDAFPAEAHLAAVAPALQAAEPEFIAGLLKYHSPGEQLTDCLLAAQTLDSAGRLDFAPDLADGFADMVVADAVGPTDCGQRLAAVVEIGHGRAGPS